MKNSILLIVAVIISLTAFGQTEKTPAIRIADLGIYNGINNYSNTNAGLSDFIKLAPTSDMLSNDFTGFTKSNFYLGSTTTDNMFNVNIGLQFYNAEKQSYNSNPQLNIGITFMSATTLSAYYSKNEEIRFDTLSSNSSSYIIYMDSIINESYQMNYLFQQIGVNANLVFRTTPQARWSLYGGFGITALASLMTGTHIFHYYSEYVNYAFPNSTSYHAYSNSQETFENYNEIHSNKTNISAFAYIPLGIDFRIAKKNEFWNKMHLVMEMQPGLAIDYIPELGTSVYGTMRGNFGMRIEI